MTSIRQSPAAGRQPSTDRRLQISSAGKRLFALLLDFIFALLLANTLVQVLRKEHWDLAMQAARWWDLLPFYGSIALVLFLKDFLGRSPGKFLLGMSVRKSGNLAQSPPFSILFRRNLMLFLAPLEGVVLLRDAYARRLADKWLGTVVIDDPKALRVMMRILLGNIILFGFFAAAILFQRSGIEKTAAYQTAEQALRSHETLRPLLEKFPEIGEVEMHLDLRENTKNHSLIHARIGGGDSGKSEPYEVVVSLIFRKNPPRWEVLKIEIKPINEN